MAALDLLVESRADRRTPTSYIPSPSRTLPTQSPELLVCDRYLHEVGDEVLERGAAVLLRGSEFAGECALDDSELPGAPAQALPVRVDEHQPVVLLLFLPRALEDCAGAPPVCGPQHQ